MLQNIRLQVNTFDKLEEQEAGAQQITVIKRLLERRSLIHRIERNDHTLTSLTFKDEMIGLGELAHLAQALKNNTCLKELVLWNNQIDSEGAMILANGLQANTSLELLRLSCNQIDAKGAEAFAEVLSKHPTLVTFDVGNNNFGDEGIQKLVTALWTNRTLQGLTVCTNGVTKDGAQKLAALVRHNLTIASIWVDIKESEKQKIVDQAFQDRKLGKAAKTSDQLITKSPEPTVSPDEHQAKACFIKSFRRRMRGEYSKAKEDLDPVSNNQSQSASEKRDGGGGSASAILCGLSRDAKTAYKNRQRRRARRIIAIFTGEDSQNEATIEQRHAILEEVATQLWTRFCEQIYMITHYEKGSESLTGLLAKDFADYVIESYLSESDHIYYETAEQTIEQMVDYIDSWRLAGKLTLCSKKHKTGNPLRPDVAVKEMIEKSGSVILRQDGTRRYTMPSGNYLYKTYGFKRIVSEKSDKSFARNMGQDELIDYFANEIAKEAISIGLEKYVPSHDLSSEAISSSSPNHNKLKRLQDKLVTVVKESGILKTTWQKMDLIQCRKLSEDISDKLIPFFYQKGACCKGKRHISIHLTNTDDLNLDQLLTEIKELLCESRGDASQVFFWQHADQATSRTMRAVNDTAMEELAPSAAAGVGVGM